MADINQQLADIVQAATDLLDVASGKVLELETAKQTAIDAIASDKSTWNTQYLNDVNTAVQTITDALTTATGAISTAQTNGVNAVISQSDSLNARINSIELYFRRARRKS